MGSFPCRDDKAGECDTFPSFRERLTELLNRPGTPGAEANRMTLKSVATLLDVLHFADSHKAVILPELSILVTYDSLRQQVLDMANALASAGIRRGDAVAIALPNGLPAIVSFLAASIAGTAAPLNPAYPYEEFLFFLDDARARALIAPSDGVDDARRAAAQRNIPIFAIEELLASPGPAPA